MKILLVEDSKEIASAIQKAMQQTGLTVEVSNHGKDALSKVAQQEYSLYILDLNLPYISGYEIAEEVRVKQPKVPIIAVTARDGISDKLKGFEVGFDDYVTKPFDMRELIARVNVLLKRSGIVIDEVLSVNGIELSSKERSVTINNKPIDLTKIEFDLLELLMQNQDAVVKNEEIIEKVWGEFDELVDPPIRTHIKNLRKKINDKDFTIIETIPGVGYKI